MGNLASKGQNFSIPEKFVVQSRGDWEKQTDRVLRSQPCVIKTVILPPGVELDDPRLKNGEVISETTIPANQGGIGSWPADTPFEADIDGRLLRTHPSQQRPPSTHFAVYPDKRFSERQCGLCQFTRTSISS